MNFLSGIPSSPIIFSKRHTVFLKAELHYGVQQYCLYICAAAIRQIEPYKQVSKFHFMHLTFNLSTLMRILQ